MASYLIVYLSYCIENAVSNILGVGSAPPEASDTPAPTRYFRISDIPSSWSKDRLVIALKTKDPGFEEKEVKVSLYPSCNGTGQIALLQLRESSELVRNLQAEDTAYLPIPSGDSTIAMSIDSHFYNLTRLNTPGSPIIAE
jgi:hypothetical protein